MLKKTVQLGRSRRKHRRRSPWLRWGCFRGENDAWEKARLGAPGLGGWEGWLFQHPATRFCI